MTEEQLERFYVNGGLGFHLRGLLRYYEEQEFEIRHFEFTDYQRPPESGMLKVLEAYDVAPKPVLLHCSAAVDRTTPVAAFIALERSLSSNLVI